MVLNPLVQRVFKGLFDRNKTSFVSPFDVRRCSLHRRPVQEDGSGLVSAYACEKARARTRGEKTREREREKQERERGHAYEKERERERECTRERGTEDAHRVAGRAATTGRVDGEIQEELKRPSDCWYVPVCRVWGDSKEDA